jgi:hypothetical protein
MAPKRNPDLTGTKQVKPTIDSTSSSLRKRPDWPSIGPVGDPEDLSLEEALPGQIFTVERLWTVNLCKKYVSFLSNLPLTTTPGKPKKGEAVRVNDRFQIDDPDFAKALWEQTALRSLITSYQDQQGDPLTSKSSPEERWGGEVLGLNSNIRIYRRE